MCRHHDRRYRRLEHQRLHTKHVNDRSTMKTHRITIVLASVIFAAAPVFAGPPEPVVEKNRTPAKAEENPWSFWLALYGWMQSLDETVGIHNDLLLREIPDAETPQLASRPSIGLKSNIPSHDPQPRMFSRVDSKDCLFLRLPRI